MHQLRTIANFFNLSPTCAPGRLYRGFLGLYGSAARFKSFLVPLQLTVKHHFSPQHNFRWDRFFNIGELLIFIIDAVGALWHLVPDALQWVAQKLRPQQYNNIWRILWILPGWLLAVSFFMCSFLLRIVYEVPGMMLKFFAQILSANIYPVILFGIWLAKSSYFKTQDIEGTVTPWCSEAKNVKIGYLFSLWAVIWGAMKLMPIVSNDNVIFVCVGNLSMDDFLKRCDAASLSNIYRKDSKLWRRILAHINGKKIVDTELYNSSRIIDIILRYKNSYPTTNNFKFIEFICETQELRKELVRQKGNDKNFCLGIYEQEKNTKCGYILLGESNFWRWNPTNEDIAHIVICIAKHKWDLPEEHHDQALQLMLSRGDKSGYDFYGNLLDDLDALFSLANTNYEVIGTTMLSSEEMKHKMHNNILQQFKAMCHEAKVNSLAEIYNILERESDGQKICQPLFIYKLVVFTKLLNQEGGGNKINFRKLTGKIADFILQDETQSWLAPNATNLKYIQDLMAIISAEILGEKKSRQVCYQIAQFYQQNTSWQFQSYDNIDFNVVSLLTTKLNASLRDLMASMIMQLWRNRDSSIINFTVQHKLQLFDNLQEKLNRFTELKRDICKLIIDKIVADWLPDDDIEQLREKLNIDSEFRKLFICSIPYARSEMVMQRFVELCGGRIYQFDATVMKLRLQEYCQHNYFSDRTSVPPYLFSQHLSGTKLFTSAELEQDAEGKDAMDKDLHRNIGGFDKGVLFVNNKRIPIYTMLDSELKSKLDLAICTFFKHNFSQRYMLGLSYIAHLWQTRFVENQIQQQAKEKKEAYFVLHISGEGITKLIASDAKNRMVVQRIEKITGIEKKGLLQPLATQDGSHKSFTVMRYVYDQQGNEVGIDLYDSYVVILDPKLFEHLPSHIQPGKYGCKLLRPDVNAEDVMINNMDILQECEIKSKLHAIYKVFAQEISAITTTELSDFIESATRYLHEMPTTKLRTQLQLCYDICDLAQQIKMSANTGLEDSLEKFGALDNIKLILEETKAKKIFNDKEQTLLADFTNKIEQELTTTNNENSSLKLTDSIGDLNTVVERALHNLHHSPQPSPNKTPRSKRVSREKLLPCRRQLFFDEKDDTEQPKIPIKQPNLGVDQKHINSYN